MATILIVDDEPLVRQLFQHALARDGHEVAAAANGIEALESIRQRTPDLILLDLAMPQMDGISFLRVLRQNRMWQKISVVVLSAIADMNAILEAGALGVKEHLLKAGFSLSQLRQRIGKLVAQDGQEPALAVSTAA